LGLAHGPAGVVLRPPARVLTAYYTPTLSRCGHAGEVNYRFVPIVVVLHQLIQVRSHRARRAALSASRLVPLVR